MTLQLSQRALTEALTFNGSSTRVYLADRWSWLLQAVRDPAAGQVVWRQFYPDAVTRQDTDEVHPELAADVGKDAVAVLQLDGEHRVRERFDDRSFNFDRVFLGHGRRCSLSQHECRPEGPTHERVAYQNWPNAANGPPPSDGREDFRPVFRYCDGVLEVGRQRAIARDDGPAVRLDLDVGSAEGQHRLDCQADARREGQPADAGAVIRNLRLLVHLRADPVADELADDAVAAWRGDVLDRGRDVADAGARDGHGDPGHHRQASRFDEGFDLCRRSSDNERPRAVAVPSVVDRAGVDRHDLADLDRAVARDAVDDLVVDRDAEARRERVALVAVALERGDGTRGPNVALGDPVQMSGRDAGLQLGLDERQDLGDDPAGGPHLLDLAARLAGHHYTIRCGDGVISRARRRRSLTAEIGSRPSMICRTPASR